MSNAVAGSGKWNERPNAAAPGLGQAESMFDLLFQRSQDAIWLFEPQAGVFVDCNAAAVELMLAGTKERLLQARPEDLSPPTQPDGSASRDKAIEVAELSAKYGGYRFEWMARRFDGQDIPLEVLSTPIPVNGHNIYVVVSRDITERKRAEATLLESQELLTSIAENISEAIYRSGPDNQLTFVNQAYLRLFGYDSFADLQALPREKLYADSTARARLLELLARDGAFSQQEVEYVRKDGTRFWGLSSARIIRDPQTGLPSYQVGAITDITERKQDEAEIRRLNQGLERRIAERTVELAASEARFRALVEHAPEAIVVFDGETGRFLFGNEHTCRLYGVTAEELTRLTPADVSPELQPNGKPSSEYAREIMQAALAGGTPVVEWLHRHSSGRLVPTEVRLLRLPAEGQNLLRASIIDNAQRHRRELIQQATYQISEAVHTTEDLDSLYRQIHAIVKSLMPAENLYIGVRNTDGQTIDFPYMVDELGLSADPIPVRRGLTGYVLSTGKTLLAGPHNAAVPGRGIEVVIDGDERVVATTCGQTVAVWLGAPLTIRGATFGVIAVQDYRNPHAYGEEEKQILTFVAGQIALAIERKRADQALRESEVKFRALFAASSQGVMLHDENQYLEVNPAAVRIFGYRTQDELRGKHPRDTSPPFQPNGQSSAVLAAERIAECMARGSARFEWTGRTAQGRDIPLEVALTRIEWSGRQIIQANISDITERKQAETELLKALAREKELGQLKSNFVSMVSHEFRTPLGVILSSAEILETYFDQLDPADRRDQLHSIQKSTRRMAGLMEEVLLLGMVEAGKMDFRPALLDVRGFCERLIQELQSATDGKCQIRFGPQGLPNEAFADERLLRHIFGNLLGNAVKYSPAGSTVEFELGRRGTEAACVVRDHGVGIPAPDLARLFNAFYRGDNVRGIPGTGLGLTIVKRCVELHHGTIRIESAVGQGTAVTVTLPLFASTPSP